MRRIAFTSRAALVDRLYKAILPDVRANEFSRVRAVAKFLADGIAANIERPNVSGVMGRIEQLLDESVAAQEYLIPDSEAEALFDLGAVNWKGLQEAFNQGRPRTAAQRLRSLLSARVAALVRLNPARMDLVERFEKLVDGLQRRKHERRNFFQQLARLQQRADPGRGSLAVRGTERGATGHLRSTHAAGADLSDNEKAQVKRVAAGTA